MSLPLSLVAGRYISLISLISTSVNQMAPMSKQEKDAKKHATREFCKDEREHLAAMLTANGCTVPENFPKKNVDTTSLGKALVALARSLGTEPMSTGNGEDRRDFLEFLSAAHDNNRAPAAVAAAAAASQIVVHTNETFMPAPSRSQPSSEPATRVNRGKAPVDPEARLALMGQYRETKERSPERASSSRNTGSTVTMASIIRLPDDDEEDVSNVSNRSTVQLERREAPAVNSRREAPAPAVHTRRPQPTQSADGEGSDDDGEELITLTKTRVVDSYAYWEAILYNEEVSRAVRETFLDYLKGIQGSPDNVDGKLVCTLPTYFHYQSGQDKTVVFYPAIHNKSVEDDGVLMNHLMQNFVQSRKKNLRIASLSGVKSLVMVWLIKKAIHYGFASSEDAGELMARGVNMFDIGFGKEPIRLPLKDFINKVWFHKMKCPKTKCIKCETCIKYPADNKIRV